MKICGDYRKAAETYDWFMESQKSECGFTEKAELQQAKKASKNKTGATAMVAPVLRQINSVIPLQDS